ncbi:MAG: site-specific integrase [Clostridiales bacterium]|nr:site-specific integrase [Clostridiales bacterium]
MVITTLKTKSSIRTIQINDDLVDLLLAMREKQIVSKYIFPSPETGDIRDTTAVTRRLHRIQDRAGLPRIRFHDLRHTFATLTLEAGVDVKTVSQMFGHTDAGFTTNTYMHVTDDMQKNAANKMKLLIENSSKNNKVIEFPA